MSKLEGYDEQDTARIKALMVKFIEGQIDSGKIDGTDVAIRAAMPQALADAKATVGAVNEYLCG